MISGSKAHFWVVLLAMGVAFQGCKISYSTTGADIPAAAQTFSVKLFRNAAPLSSPNYDLRITESLKDLLLEQTRLDLVEKRGDLQFDGVITNYVTGNAAVTADEVTAFNRLTITLKVSYINTLDREKNFERSFSRFADYSSTQDFNQVENQLIEEINEQLVQDIFDASLGAW
jgi:hypothetical protein